MQTILAMLDAIAERLERRDAIGLSATVDRTHELLSRQRSIATLLDTVSEALSSRKGCRGNATCKRLVGEIDRLAERYDSGTGSFARADVELLDRASDMLARYGVGARLVHRVDAAAERVETFGLERGGAADSVLADSAGQIVQAVACYGAGPYRVDGSTVQIEIDRGGGTKTTAELQFCTRDEVGKPQLRLLFRCGDDKLVRWASVDRIDADAITTAVQHVFATGENYGRHVVTAGVAQQNPYSPRPRRS